MSKHKIAILQKEIARNNLDGFIIPSNDEFFSEYTPYYSNRLRYITNFKGSSGLALILLDKILFFTDARYISQAKLELDKSFEIIDINLFNLNNWLEKNNKQNLKIGFDPSLHTEKFLDSSVCKLIATKNLVDEIWYDKPLKPNSIIFDYEIEYSGIDSKHKINQLLNFLDKHNLDHILICDSASICWLLNIRGKDIEYTPILLCYLLASKDGILKIFTDSEETIEAAHKIPFESLQYELSLPGSNIAIDKNNTSLNFIEILKKSKANIIDIKNPCLIWKSCKNSIEIENIKQAHILDGLAICRFFFWLKNNENNNTELTLIQKLKEFKKLEPKYQQDSFSTICGFGSNGAIIHYKANELSNKKITQGILLIDSGSHYKLGTTDVTRTIAIGNPSNEQKENFTRVLKGHIAIASTKFPTGTTGSQLDSLARYHLWQVGLDYGHSTGHGVGCYLSVHEGPQYIGTKSNDIKLKKGMIISNEPGYYKQGKYGIRIENLLHIVNSVYDGFLEFSDLTIVPIDYKLIDSNILNSQEKKWLVDYHQKIYDNITTLDSALQKWLYDYVEFYTAILKAK